MEEQTVSVIVPSLNGAGRLPKLLDALDRQTYRNFETVVVLDGSTDGSLALLKTRNTSYPLRALTRENGGRAAARNTGAHAARGTILVFYDDDMEPDPTSIARHVDVINRFHNAVSAGQQLEKADEATDFTTYKTYLTEKWVRHLGRDPMPLPEKDLFLTAANMAMRREDFVKLGGFDEVLRDAEDFDLAVRAHTAGLSVVFDPKNHGYHRSFTTLAEYIQRQRQYRKAHRVLKSKRADHPNRELYGRYDVAKSRLKNLVYFFIPGFAVRLVDKGLVSNFNEKWKFRVFMWLTSALSVYYPRRRI